MNKAVGLTKTGCMRTHIDDVFALITFLVVWAGTARYLADDDTIDIARSTRHINRLFRNIVSTASCSINHEHPGFPVRLTFSYRRGHYRPLRCCSMQLFEVRPGRLLTKSFQSLLLVRLPRSSPLFLRWR